MSLLHTSWSRHLRTHPLHCDPGARQPPEPRCVGGPRCSARVPPVRQPGVQLRILVGVGPQVHSGASTWARIGNSILGCNLGNLNFQSGAREHTGDRALPASASGSSAKRSASRPEGKSGGKMDQSRQQSKTWRTAASERDCLKDCRPFPRSQKPNCSQAPGSSSCLRDTAASLCLHLSRALTAGAIPNLTQL